MIDQRQNHELRQLLNACEIFSDGLFRRLLPLLRQDQGILTYDSEDLARMFGTTPYRITHALRDLRRHHVLTLRTGKYYCRLIWSEWNGETLDEVK